MLAKNFKNFYGVFTEDSIIVIARHGGEEKSPAVFSDKKQADIFMRDAFRSPNCPHKYLYALKCTITIDSDPLHLQK